jgi:signal transduction histidine kinase
MMLAPGTLSGRLFLILLTGMLLAVGITYTLVRVERMNELSQFRLRTDAERIASVIRLLDALPAEARPAAQRAMERQHVHILPAVSDAPSGEPVPALADSLASVLGGDRAAELWRLREEPCRFVQAGSQSAPVPQLGSVDCRVVVYRARLPLADGTQVVLEVPLRSLRPEPPFLLRPHALLIFVVLIVASAMLAVRVATRPLRELVTAADALGRNIEGPPLPERGPRELRVAAKAFNAMQTRIRSQIEERTHMLAAITHDLKTPLTRMKLRLEQLSDLELKGRLGLDVGAMQSLIDEGLNMARSLDDRTPFVELDLNSLVASVCADAVEAGMDIAWDGDDSARRLIRVRGRADDLRRVFSNLIDNAVKYGRRAQVDLTQEESGHGAWARVSVRDWGPGIPAAQMQDVLKPYYRIEESRSRETGGTGLGLAIAANIVRAHGGALILRNRPGGGLEAAVTVPLAQP